MYVFSNTIDVIDLDFDNIQNRILNTRCIYLTLLLLNNMQ